MFCSMCETVTSPTAQEANQQVRREVVRRYLGVVTDIEYSVARLRWVMHPLQIYCAPMAGLARRPPFLFEPATMAPMHRRVSLR
jgi:hypothetical protein